MHGATGKGRCLAIAKAMDLISLGHSFSSPYLLRLIPDQFGFDRLHAPEDIRLGAVHLGAESLCL